MIYDSSAADALHDAVGQGLSICRRAGDTSGLLGFGPRTS